MMLLSEQQPLIRDTARQYAADVLAAPAAENDALPCFPAQAVQQRGQLGLLGMLVPEQYGGADTGHVANALALEDIAAGEAACSTIMSVHSSVGCMPILKLGSEEQKARYLAALARGEALAAFCLSESDASSEASALRSQATYQTGLYQLNGTRQFITSGKHAQVAIVFARTVEGKHGISALIVQTENPGFVVSRVEDKSGTARLGHLPDQPEQLLSSRVRSPGSGRRWLSYHSEQSGGCGRIGIAAQCVGMARSAYEHALKFAQERQTFGKAIIEHQSIAFKSRVSLLNQQTWLLRLKQPDYCPCRQPVFGMHSNHALWNFLYGQAVCQ